MDQQRQGSRSGKKDPAAGLRIEIAQRPDQVAAAWELVYQAYRDAELIEDNPHRIHTVPQAIRPTTSVVVAYEGKKVVSTLTIMHDGPVGLPLDRVYQPHLDRMRQDGKRLMEVGLFADSQLPISRATVAFREMMRFVFYSSCWSLADIVIGVHPSHSKYYIRQFGFETAGPVSVHPIVRNRPVVLLHGETKRQLSLNPMPRSIAEYVDRPLPRSSFDRKLRLAPETIAGTAIGGFVDMLAELWNNVTYVPRLAGTISA
ncbi:MAG: hypothetical protein WD768_13995 [Phycisphaeraceae bacterium]